MADPPISLNQIFVMVQSEDGDQMIRAIRRVERLVMDRDTASIDSLAEAGIVAYLVSCTNSENAHIKILAALSLEGIARLRGEHVKEEDIANTAAILIEGLHTPDEFLVLCCLLELTNIIGQSPQHRDYCVEVGLLESLQRLVERDLDSHYEDVSVIIETLLKFNESQLATDKINMLVPIVMPFLDHSDPSVIVQGVVPIYHLSRDSDGLQALIDSRVFLKLVALVYHSNIEVVYNVVGTVFCIIGNCTDDQLLNVLRGSRLGRAMPMLIAHDDERIREISHLILNNVVPSREGDAFPESDEEHELADNERELRAAEDEHRAIAVSTTLFGPCTICCDEEIVEPTICRNCRGVVGCFTCAARWIRASPAPKCPLCRHEWPVIAEEAITAKLM